ncbi:MAG: hypothetical protein KF729_36255 [Sandaracinaceae bacterium]|nr:hypothetical protein [Sandaracinaceae bacterium]
MRRALVWILALVAGCGASPPPPAPAPAGRPPVGPLSTLVPVESRLVVLAAPERLWSSGPTEHVLRAVLDDAQLDRFASRTGVDVRALRELVIATQPEGRVALARGAFDATMAVREAGERMAPVESAADDPVVRRVGFLGRGRVDAAALDAETILHVDGPPALAAAVLRASSRPAPRRPELGARCPLGEHASAPLVFCAPHPLELPLDTGIGVLLARERTFVASVRPEDGQLWVRAELWGEFPPGVAENLRAFAESIAARDLGSVLGLREALSTLVVEADEAHVRAAAAFDPARLATGLRALLVAEIEELIEGPLSGGAP